MFNKYINFCRWLDFFGIGSDRSTNWTTTTAPPLSLFYNSRLLINTNFTNDSDKLKVRKKEHHIDHFGKLIRHVVDLSWFFTLLTSKVVWQKFLVYFIGIKVKTDTDCKYLQPSEVVLPDVDAIGVRSLSKCSELMSIICWTSWHILKAETGADSWLIDSQGASFMWDPLAGFEEDPRLS